MKTLTNILFAIICIAVLGGTTKSTNQNDPITGTWKGTSICQVKNSSCNDEVIVCHITKAAASNTYKLVMNKMVNNAEDNMGELNFIYNEAQHTLTCHSVTRFDGLWKFELKKNTMDGTLTVDNKTLYRVIKLVKDAE
jgi:hypothetical protein